MAITKLQAESLNLADDFTFTGTVAGSASNTPAFESYLATTQSIASNAWVKMQPDAKIFDTDNCYDNTTNYRFTPTVAGKYFMSATAYFYFAANYDVFIAIKIQKNGSDAVDAMEFSQRVTTNDVLSISTNRVFDMNGTTDYLETYVYQINYNGGATRNLRPLASQRKFCTFGGYKLTGV